MENSAPAMNLLTTVKLKERYKINLNKIYTSEMKTEKRKVTYTYIKYLINFAYK